LACLLALVALDCLAQQFGEDRLVVVGKIVEHRAIMKCSRGERQASDRWGDALGTRGRLRYAGVDAEEVGSMRRLRMGIAAATITVAAVSPSWAEFPPPGGYPDPYRYRFVAPTPEDAYRQGLINRWELEQLQGLTPQAEQGPSPNGSRDFSK
jgi:hypothetical protein